MNIINRLLKNKSSKSEDIRTAVDTLFQPWISSDDRVQNKGFNMIEYSKSFDLSLGMDSLNLNLDDIYSSVELQETANLNPLSTAKDKSLLSSAAWLFQGDDQILSI